MLEKKNFFTLFKERRTRLLERLKKTYPDREGLVILWAGFEHAQISFRQESSFYYFTGLEEPGTVLVLEWSGKSTLYIPRYASQREQWVPTSFKMDDSGAEYYGVDEIKFLGEELTSHCISPFFSNAEYTQLLKIIEQALQQNISLFSLAHIRSVALIDQKMVLDRIARILPGFEESLVDISSYIAQLRRVKSKKEIELLYKAIEVTVDAHQTAAYLIKPDRNEAEVHAAIEYRFIQAHARSAFPSIVGGGKNGIILHYHHNNEVLRKDELVVVDIGADLNYYCADLTRTYPISGEFTKRQRELYELVLRVQEEVAAAAKPGMWLNNKEKPEQSLHHIAVKLFEEQGYAKYFIHSIGHFLGIDVHDVGNIREPLQEGDVITIEPGLYIPEEKIGIRIEDDYWIIPDGSICLSENLPRSVNEIEQMVQHSFDEEKEEESKEEAH